MVNWLSKKKKKKTHSLCAKTDQSRDLISMIDVIKAMTAFSKEPTFFFWFTKYFMVAEQSVVNADFVFIYYTIGFITVKHL